VKSLIFLALGSSIYKKKAVARFYCNEILFDEFEIIDHLNKDGVRHVDPLNPTESVDPLNPVQPVSMHFFELDNMKKYKIYEADLPENGEIKIEIINNINNFTNGFMTRYTKVALHYINIVPEKVFQKLSADQCDRWFYRKKYFKKDIQSIKKWYKVKYTMLHNMRPWVSFHNEDGHINHNVAENYFGTNGSFRLKYNRKHGLYHCDRIIGFNKMIDGHVFQVLKNKYTQYEN